MAQGAIITPGLVQTRQLLTAATATGAGDNQRGVCGPMSFQASGTTSAGAGSATIEVQVSNDASNWDTLGTITLTLGTSSTSDSFATDSRYGWYRMNVTAISGTDATVYGSVGY